MLVGEEILTSHISTTMLSFNHKKRAEELSVLAKYFRKDSVAFTRW